jgi:hypothetical protein
MMDERGPSESISKWGDKHSFDPLNPLGLVTFILGLLDTLDMIWFYIWYSPREEVEE